MRLVRHHREKHDDGRDGKHSPPVHASAVPTLASISGAVRSYHDRPWPFVRSCAQGSSWKVRSVAIQRLSSGSDYGKSVVVQFKLVRVLGTQMIELQLTALAKARVWFHRATPEFVASGTVNRSVEVSSTSLVRREYLTLEAYVPRGGHAEYGLLGFHFEREVANPLQVNVPYMEEGGRPWLDSLTAQVDDIRVGLPREFAVPVLDAIAGFASHGFPAGKLTVVEAAHGQVGSSEQFLRRVVACALSMMVNDHEFESKNVAAFLMEGLMGNG